MMRIALFLLTNLAVLVLLGVVMWALENVFGVRLGNNGALLVMAAVFGFGGSLISLAMSKWIALRSTGAQIITQPRNEGEAWLLATVRRQADANGIGMPDVAVYDGPEINAFATGANRNKALVAVSTGLLRGMERDEIEAVLGHEVAHVANGDMITMALLQGVVNTFVIVLARIVGRAVDSYLGGGRDSPGPMYWVVVMVLQIVFGLLASIVTMWFSRRREFRADAGGAQVAGKQKMIAALERLAKSYGQTTLPNEVRAFGISGHVSNGLKRLFMTHPPLAERIAALRNG